MRLSISTYLLKRTALLAFAIVWAKVWAAEKPADGMYVSVGLYNQEFTFPAMPEMEQKLPEKLSEQAFVSVYHHFESTEYYPLLKKFGDYRRGFNLNDWFFYNLIAKYSETVFGESGRNFQVLFQWFMLRKSGIDVRLFHTEKEVFLNALSEDIEFGFYLMDVAGKKYANLTAKRDNLQLGSLTAYMPAFLPDSASMPMSMKLNYQPRLTQGKLIDRLLEFKHDGTTYVLKVQLNAQWLKMVDDYPFYNQKNYFEIGLSREAEASLIPQMQNWMTEMDELEKVRFLLSFTRTAFFYKEDEGKYGKEKPMTPEQTLYHSYSDCEDRSALFYYLCKQLTGLPQIVLDFDNHVGVAVELKDIEGDYYKYKGRKFFYCEPTGPQDILEPGQMWEKVRNEKARILLEYIP